jgi:hypothetical protein
MAVTPDSSGAKRARTLIIACFMLQGVVTFKHSPDLTT